MRFDKFSIAAPEQKAYRFDFPPRSMRSIAYTKFYVPEAGLGQGVQPELSTGVPNWDPKLRRSLGPAPLGSLPATKHGSSTDSRV